MQNFSPQEEKNVSLVPVVKKTPVPAETTAAPLQETTKTSTPIVPKMGRLASPRKSNKRTSMGNGGGDAKSSMAAASICDVCKAEGTNQNLVRYEYFRVVVYCFIVKFAPKGTCNDAIYCKSLR